MTALERIPPRLGIDSMLGRRRWMVWHPRAARVIAMIDADLGCPFDDPSCPACLELRNVSA